MLSMYFSSPENLQNIHSNKQIFSRLIFATKMSVSVVMAVLVVTVLVPSQCQMETDYCGLSSQHTMCLYRQAVQGQACVAVTQRGVNTTEAANVAEAAGAAAATKAAKAAEVAPPLWVDWQPRPQRPPEQP